MTPLVQRLSCSSIFSYLACPYRWYLGQVRRVVRPTSEAALFGSAVHAAVERTIVATTRGETPDVAALWETALGEQVAKNERGAGVDWRQGRDALLAEGLALLTDPGPVAVEVHTVDAPDRPIAFPDLPSWLATIRVAMEGDRPAVEKFVRMEIEGIEIPFVGFVDWVEADGVAADLKTTTWPWSAESAALELQPTYYLAALAGPGRFRHYVLVRGDRPRVQVFETERTAADIAWAFDLARGVWRAIQAELFHPNPTYRWCGPRYCEYWDDCRGGARS
jgi:hypothetical protein